MLMIIIYLDCATTKEAGVIADSIIKKRLAACVRISPVDSRYWLADDIEHEDKVLIMIETIESKFNAIEEVVKRIHSYPLFVMTAVSVVKMSAGVKNWLNDSIK